MRGVVSIIAASLMTTSAWASDLTIQTVGDLYTDQPVGFEVTGLAEGEGVRLQFIEDDGDVGALGTAMGDANGTARIYGLLTDNAESVTVRARTLAGSEATATFSIEAVPDGEYYCDADSTDWDEVAGACVSSVEETLNCWQSGFCQEADDLWDTGRPNSIVGNATESDCIDSPLLQNVVEWSEGTYHADQLPSDLVPAWSYHLCE